MSDPKDEELFEECTCECGRCEWCELEPASESKPMYGYRWLNNLKGGWKKNKTHMTLLVRCLIELGDGVCIRGHGVVYQCNEFIKVEVPFRPDRDVSQEYCYDPLLDCSDIEDVMRVGPTTVYVMGSSFMPGVTVDDSLTPEFCSRPIACLKGMSWFDLNKNREDQTWNAAASPEIYRQDLRCVAFDGHIYCLVSAHLDDSIVYHPNEDRWVNLNLKQPKYLSDCYVSPKLIADYANKRVLVHLSGQNVPSCVFAWYPHRDTHNWVCLKEDIWCRIWEQNNPTLLGGSLLVFFHGTTRQLFRVLDLETGEWLKVKWTSPYGQHLRKHEPRSMFDMGDDQFCLCFSRSFYPPSFVSIAIVAIFEFKRSSDSLVTFTHRFTKTFHTEHITPVDFIPLS